MRSDYRPSSLTLMIKLKYQLNQQIKHYLSLFLGLLAPVCPMLFFSFSFSFSCSTPFSLNLSSSLICFKNQAQLGITSKFISKLGRGSSSSISIQSNILSSRQPNCSIFWCITVLQYTYRGFSQKLRFLVYLKSCKSQGYPAKSYSSGIYCLILITVRAFYSYVFLGCLAASDQGREPFTQQSIRYRSDQRSSFLLMPSPRLYLRLENSRLIVRGYGLLTYATCSRVCASLYLEAAPQSTMKNLPCFYPGPTMMFCGLI